MDSLSPEDWKRFLTAAKKVIRRELKVMGDPVKYMASMRVYNKTVDPLGNKVEKHRTKGNRTTFWVPAVQK